MQHQPHTATVKKVVVPRRECSFSIILVHQDGGAAVNFESDGDNLIDPAGGNGSDILETNAPGYKTTYQNCTSVKKGEICTITNTKIPDGTVIVKKVLVNDDNGILKTPDKFKFTLNGGAQTTFEADGDNAFTLPANTIVNVAEVPTAGYTSATSNCTGLVVPSVGTVTCTITNDDNGPGKGTLMVKKVVTNDNGGSADPTAFSFSVDGGTAQPFDAAGQVTLALPTGPHSVVEVANSGYTTTYSNSLNGSANGTNLNVTKGGLATCTVTNNDQAGDA